MTKPESDPLEEMRRVEDLGEYLSMRTFMGWVAAWEKERAEWKEILRWKVRESALRAAMERIEAYCRGEAAKFDPEADDGIQGAYSECADLLAASLRAAREPNRPQEE